MEAAEGEEEVEEEASEEGEGVEDSEEDTSAEVRTEEAAEAGAGVAEGVSTRDYSNYYSRSKPEYLYINSCMMCVCVAVCYMLVTKC